MVVVVQQAFFNLNRIQNFLAVFTYKSSILFFAEILLAMLHTDKW